MSSNTSFLLALAAGFTVLFSVAYGLSRLGLRLAGRYSDHWYVILAVHAAAFFVSGYFYVAVEAWMFLALPTQYYYFIFSYGCLLYTQLCLAIGDIVQTRVRRTYVLPAAAMVAFGVGYFCAWLNPYAYGKPSAFEAQLALALDVQGRNRDTAPAMKRNFPQEYQAFVGAYRTSLGTANSPEDFAKVYAPVAGDFFRSASALARQHRTEVERAPDRYLVALARAQLSNIETIRKEPELCAAMAGGRPLQPALRDAPASQQFNSSIGKVIATSLDAARAGLDHPVPRQLKTIPPDIKQAYSAAVRGTVTEFENASPAQQCDSAIAIYQAIVKLPPPQAATLTAFLVAHNPH